MKPPPSEIIITDDNVGEYFKVIEQGDFMSSFFEWKNEKYGLYMIDQSDSNNVYVNWNILEPNKYLISFDYYSATGMAYISINDPQDDARIDIDIDPMGNGTGVTGSVDYKPINNTLSFESRAYGMPSPEHIYLEISNIRLKPIQ